jgi:hypothetical protein
MVAGGRRSMGKANLRRMVVQHQMQESLYLMTTFPLITTVRPAEAVRFININIPEVGTVDEGSYRMIAAGE